MAEGTLVQQLAHLIASASPASLPPQVLASARNRVLDTLGICLAAVPLDTSAAVVGWVVGQGGTPEARAVGVAEPMPAALAALINGTLAHSLDYDDTHLPSVLHPSATLVPACLAAAEARGASGPELLAAVAAGLEVCVRLGMAGYDRTVRNSTYFDRGQHATSMCGAIAAAGSVARLYGLGEEGISHAMAVAASMASGLIEANRTGGTVKRVHCGWAAHSAIMAAGLAAHGLTGPPTVLEGRFGFFQAFLSGQYDGDAVTSGLGEDWLVSSIHFKPYPANHFTHAAIDAAIDLRKRGLTPGSVESLHLGVAEPTVRTIGEPIELKRAPQTGYQAQFSGPYTVVAALLGGGGLGLNLDDFTDQLARDPDRRALMAKVSVAGDAFCTERFPEAFAAVLSARTHTGEVLEARVPTNRGGPERPLSDSELHLKFSDNARRRVTGPWPDRIASQIEALAGSGSAADLATLIACAESTSRPESNQPKSTGS